MKKGAILEESVNLVFSESITKFFTGIRYSHIDLIQFDKNFTIGKENDNRPVCDGGSEGCLVDEVDEARAVDEALEERGIWDRRRYKQSMLRRLTIFSGEYKMKRRGKQEESILQKSNSIKIDSTPLQERFYEEQLR
jgi:hypothetical protein